MIKQMITEAIKAASSKPMEALRQRLANFFSDGIISDWERQQIEKDAEAIANDLDRQFSWADEYMKGDEKNLLLRIQPKEDLLPCLRKPVMS